MYYLVNTVDLLSWVDHKPTPGARLHGECFPFFSKSLGKTNKTIGQNEVGSVRRTDGPLAEELGIPDSSGSASLVAENLAL